MDRTPDSKPADISEVLRRQNIANIIKRVKAGKPLTRTQEEQLQEYEEATASPGKLSTAQWAKFWCITQRTAQRWVKATKAGDMPSMDNEPEMLRWSLGPGRKPPPFLRRCAELRAAGSKVADIAAAGEGHAELRGDWAAFAKEHATTSTRGQAAQIQSLERELDFASFALARARERGDDFAQRKYSDELIRFSKAVKEQKLLADKLGFETGSLLGKDEVIRIIRAHAYWCMRGSDMALDSLSRKLVNLSSPKDVRAALESELLSVRFVSAYARAVRTVAGNSLPEWVTETIRDAVDDFIENGAALHDAAVAGSGKKEAQ